jgi:hypothetical protein
MRSLITDDFDTGQSRNGRAKRQRGGVFGPYSKAIDRGAIGSTIDGRSTAGRFLKAYEAMLVEHVGGRPSITERAMIARAARVALHLELLDEKSLAECRPLTGHDMAWYAAWSNCLTRILGRLGLKSPDKPAPTLTDLLSANGRGEAA